jgi:hypothetical protein
VREDMRLFSLFTILIDYMVRCDERELAAKTHSAPFRGMKRSPSTAEKLAKGPLQRSEVRSCFLQTPSRVHVRFRLSDSSNPLGAPPALTCSLDSFAIERKAAELAFGWKGLPRYDLAQARYALGVGADFLGGWASPVYYSRQFGHFRQGRPVCEVNWSMPNPECRLRPRVQTSGFRSALVSSHICCSLLRVCCWMRNSCATRKHISALKRNRCLRQISPASSALRDR